MSGTKPGLKITPVMRQGGCLVQLEGVLDHTLDATQLAGANGGILILDLEGVRRVSSNGVREWIRALKATPRTYLGFVRAHPAVVSQFNMVNKFAAGGELLDFYAPYICAGCKKEFELLVDVRKAHPQLAAFSAPAAVCPHCGAAGALDDLPSSYFGYVATSPPPSPPPLVDQMLGATGAGAGTTFKVEKAVTGTTTALRFSGSLDSGAHLKRVADGLDGEILVILDGVTRFTDEGVQKLASFLASEGLSFLLARVPVGLATALARSAGELSRVAVISVQLRLECGKCRAASYVELAAEDLDPPPLPGAQVTCDECAAEIPIEIEPAQREGLLRLTRTRAPREIANYLGRAASGGTAATAQTQTFGRYQLLEKIGTGGMAEVFLARQTGAAGFAKAVVVKRILGHLASEKTFVDMFLQEARLASRIAHPNVVSIFDLGETSGSYFIAMEHVRGWDLNTILERAKEAQHPLPLSLAAYIASCICAGLEAAHTSVDEAGRLAPIIHRDVSPHNVLISYDGQVKLADFGIAKAIDLSQPATTTAVKGKLAYMAPEQIAGGSVPIDGRLDIFPTGIVLFQLLTFRHPFPGETEFLTLKTILEGPTPRASEFRKDTPRELDAIVARAMARDVSQRYQSALLLQRDLERFFNGQQTGALTAWLAELQRLTASMPKRLEAPAITAPLAAGG